MPADRKPAEVRRVLAVVRFPVGGVRTHLLYTYPLLLEAGYRFTFVLPNTPIAGPFREDIAGWPDVEVIEAPMKNRLREVYAFVRTLRGLLRQRRFALIHSHGLQAAVRVVLANLGYHVPHIATSQALFGPETAFESWGNAKLWLLERILTRVDTLIAVSNDTREDHLRHLPRLGSVPGKIVTIHNGIPVRPFSVEPVSQENTIREQLGVPSDVRLLGFLGRFMKQKGFLQLIDALSEVARSSPSTPFHLVAVGSGDQLLEYQRYLAQKPELAGKVSFLPHTPDPISIREHSGFVGGNWSGKKPSSRR